MQKSLERGQICSKVHSVLQKDFFREIIAQASSPKKDPKKATEFSCSSLLSSDLNRLKLLEAEPKWSALCISLVNWRRTPR